MTDLTNIHHHYDSTDGLPLGWLIRTFKEPHRSSCLMKDEVVVAKQRNAHHWLSVVKLPKAQKIIDDIIKERNAVITAQKAKQEAEYEAELAADKKKAEVAAYIALGL